MTRLRSRIRSLHRQIVLRRGLRMLRRNPRGSARIWRDLVYGWGNEAYSGRPAYLEALAAAALRNSGPILECGSGITTLVLATIARHTGSPIYSLEHDPRWFHTIQCALHDLRLAADVRLTPLRTYSEFDWYDIDPSDLPLLSLVICDGPPDSTRGGRFGLLPVLRDRLRPGSRVLLDDAGRASERDVLVRWRREMGLEYEIIGAEDPYAVIELAEGS
jgi:hypothetical protein